MSLIIIAGTFRVPAGNVERIRPHMERMLSGSRGEDGCITYSHAFDVQDPGLVRLFEMWRDQAAIDAHRTAPHTAAWRAAAAELEVSDRRFVAYDVAAERPL